MTTLIFEPLYFQKSYTIFDKLSPDEFTKFSCFFWYVGFWPKILVFRTQPAFFAKIKYLFTKSTRTSEGGTLKEHLLVTIINFVLNGKFKNVHCPGSLLHKVHIFWEGHKILRNLHRRFDWHYIGQIYSEDFKKFCGLLRIYEL